MATMPTPLFRHATTLELPVNKRNNGNGSPGIRDVDIWKIISYCPRDDSVPPSNSPEHGSRPGSGKSKNGPISSRCFILGPTRQQTEIYFKRKRLKSRRSGKYQGVTLRRSSARAETGLRSRNCEVVPVEEKINELSIQQEKPRSSIARLNSSSSIPTSKTSQSSESRSDASFYSELIKPMQYRIRGNKKETKEKVITPSKHGFHPRSQSPTFKRLIEVTDKLQNLFERDSERSDGTKESLYDEDLGKQRCGSPSEEYIDHSATRRYNKTSVRDIIRVEATSSTVQRAGRSLKDKWETPIDNHHSQVNINDSASNDGSDSGVSSETYFKIDFQGKQSDSQKLHLFLPQISDQTVTPDIKLQSLGSTNAQDSGRSFLPSIAQQQQTNNSQKPQVITVTRRSNRNNSNNRNKKRRKVIVNRCPSAHDTDRQILDHLNDVPTLISLEYENEHAPHSDHKHPEGACPFGDKCQVHNVATKV